MEILILFPKSKHASPHVDLSLDEMLNPRQRCNPVCFQMDFISKFELSQNTSGQLVVVTHKGAFVVVFES